MPVQWNYRVLDTGEVVGWDTEFLTAAGLPELAADLDRAGRAVLEPGRPVGAGLTCRAAAELGLSPGTPVSTSLIDAHAGALGLLGSCGSGEVEGRLGLVTGTSTCHLLLSPSPRPVPGVWGPFFSAVLPGYWVTEAGQSSTGGLVDHVINSHPARLEAEQRAAAAATTVYAVLETELTRLAESRGVVVTQLTSAIHMWPDYHGNRSPVADPSLTGALVGLTLNVDLTSLALLYLATLQAVSYGTRHIVDALVAAGHTVTRVAVCGGLARSLLYLQTQADVLGVEVVVPGEGESVLLGAAILAMSAAIPATGLQTFTARLGTAAQGHSVVKPTTENQKFHAAKYRVFLQMLQDQFKYRDIMKEFSG